MTTRLGVCVKPDAIGLIDLVLFQMHFVDQSPWAYSQSRKVRLDGLLHGYGNKPNRLGLDWSRKRD